MMNKLQSAKVNLLRFLFVLPLLAVVLVSFRKQIGDTLSGKSNNQRVFTDTIPDVKQLNSKGYYIDVKDKKGECELLIRDENRKEVKRILLTEWNKDKEHYEGLYGEILPPPPPKAGIPAPPQSSKMKDFLKRNPSVKNVGWVYNRDNSAAIIHITKMDGTTEQYRVDNENELKTAEDKYGELPIVAAPPIPPAPANAPVPPAATSPASPPPPGGYDDPVSRVSNEFEITNEKAVITLKNGTVEKYDLTDKKSRADFESKYGRIISATTADITAPVVVLGNGVGLSKSIAATPIASVNGELATTTIAPSTAKAGVASATPIASTIGGLTTAVIAPSPIRGGVNSVSPVATTAPLAGVAMIDDRGYLITGKEDIVIYITKKTTRKELDAYIQQMKEKDIELSYDEIEYNDKGQLVSISGTMSAGDGSKSRFVANDFEKLTLAMIKRDNRTYFKVGTQDKKEVI